MDKKRVAELRKFISTITDPNISAFIDLKKLCQSGIYNMAVQMAMEHAAAHSDFNYLEKILHLLDGSMHAAGYIAALKPKLNFIVTDTKPRKFKKATLEQIAKEEQALRTPIALNSGPTKPAKKGVKKKVSYDIMDSQLMLSGCYGNGKRR